MLHSGSIFGRQEIGMVALLCRGGYADIGAVAGDSTIGSIVLFVLTFLLQFGSLIPFRIHDFIVSVGRLPFSELNFTRFAVFDLIAFFLLRDEFRSFSGFVEINLPQLFL